MGNSLHTTNKPSTSNARGKHKRKREHDTSPGPMAQISPGWNGLHYVGALGTNQIAEME